MCKLCDEGRPQNHSDGNDSEPRWNPRRGFLKAAGAGSAAVGGLAMFSPREAQAHDDREPEYSGHRGRRYLIKGGSVMSMDPKVGDFAEADVLVEGKKIVAVGPNLRAWGVPVIDARGRIVMPGFVDTHHHLFETALRSFLADGLLFDGLDANITQNYFQKILLTFAPQYKPEDVYINTLFGSLSPARCRRDDGARHLADPPFAGALRRVDQGAARRWPARGVRLLRERRRRGRQPVPGRRAPHPHAALQLVRPAGDDDDGRRDLPAGLRGGVGARARARPAGGLPHRRHLRHAADLRRAGHGQRLRPRQPVHPHDRHVRLRVAEGQGRRRGGVAGGADRDEHDARHAADPEGAVARLPAVAVDRRGVHADGRHVHADAHRDGAAAHVRQRHQAGRAGHAARRWHRC